MTDLHPSRRTVLGATALSAMGVSVVSACSTGSGDSSRTPTAGETIAALDDLTDGQTIVVTTSNGTPVVLTREGETVVAHSGVCPHQGCSVRAEVNNLLCPCHNSKFQFDGTYISGPANASLPAEQASVIDGAVVLG